MIGISIDEVNEVILHFKKELDVYENRLPHKLNRLLSEFTHPDELDYTRYLITIADQIIRALPPKLSEFKAELDQRIHPDILIANHSAYRDRLIVILGYSARRKDFYPQYFRKLGIKACVYCNSLSALTVERAKKQGAVVGKIRAKFQVDHYLSKDANPGLCISLFNLYPVCANCNNVKGTKDVLFDLYIEKPVSASTFKFYLKDGSQANYLLTRDLKDIIIGFNQPLVVDGSQDFDLLFDIKPIYDEHKDIVEELILKAEIYTPAYRETLKDNFSDIFKTKEMLDRLIIGNYPEDKDIHKRPLAKFMKDISLDIGLLKHDPSVNI